MSRESFLTRWSRRKLAAQDGDPLEPARRTVRDDDAVKPASPAVRNSDPLESAPSVAPSADQEDLTAKPELPPLDSISLDTGVAAFLRPGVEEGLRRLALKKLFSDAHFNTIDGLDVYIDDYSRPDPIPPVILKRLVQAQTLLFDKDVESTKTDELPPQSDLPAAAPVADTTMVSVLDPEDSPREEV